MKKLMENHVLLMLFSMDVTKKYLDSSTRVQLLKKLGIFSRLLMKELQSMSRLQLLTTKIENIRMKEGEKITYFNVRLCDISNISFSLGEKISEEKLARKILRSLLKRFDVKSTSIEEA